jgi:PAS domain-containing protein
VKGFKDMLPLSNAQCSDVKQQTVHVFTTLLERVNWGENGDRTFENRALREIFGSKAEEMRGK